MRWALAIVLLVIGLGCARRGGTRAQTGPPLVTTRDLVQRVRARSGDEWTLTTEFPGGAFRFRWLAIPARDGTHLGLTLVAPAAPGRDACPVRAMIDGVLTQLVLGTPHLVEGEDRLSMTVTLEFARSIAAAQRVAFRVCEDEATIGPREQAIMSELLRRFDEELSWQGQGAVQSITPAQ